MPDGVGFMQGDLTQSLIEILGVLIRGMKEGMQKNGCENH